MRKFFKKFRSTSEYSQGSWALTLPKYWSLVDDDDGVASFAADNGVGALQVSSYNKNGSITDSDLLEFAKDMEIQPHDLQTTVKGAFTGFTSEITDRGMYLRHWYLRSKSTMMFVTYNCEIDDSLIEEQVVGEILSTLRYTQH